MYFKPSSRFKCPKRRARKLLTDDLSDVYMQMHRDSGNHDVRSDPLKHFEYEEELKNSLVKDRSYYQRSSVDERLDDETNHLIYRSDDNYLLREAHAEMWENQRLEKLERKEKLKKEIALKSPKPEFTAKNLEHIASYGITKLDKIAKYFQIGTAELRDLIKENPQIAEVIYSSKEHAHLDLNKRLFQIAMGEEKASKATVEAMVYLLKTVFKQNEQDDYLKEKIKLQKEEIQMDKAKLHFQQLSTAAKVSNEWSDDKVTEFLEKTAKLNESILGKPKLKIKESETEE